MIGGYIYDRKDQDFEARLLARLNPKWHRHDVPNHGLLFHTDPFHSGCNPIYIGNGLIALSEDMLVVQDDAKRYQLLDFDSGFGAGFARHVPETLNSIHSDFRMAVISTAGTSPKVYLASNRAGSGRIYYHKTDHGIAFCSDLRFLLKIVPFEVDRMAIYAILKYGSAPEPLTICKGVSSVPVAHYLEYDVAENRGTAAPYFRYRFAEALDRAATDESAILQPAEEALRNTARFLGCQPLSMLLSGGIDSSLYGCYLKSEQNAAPQGFYCSFGRDDPEKPYASAIAERLGAPLQIADMTRNDALKALDDVARLTDHPFSDFSSLPITFLLQFIRDHQKQGSMVIECNGGDDCFGFGYLGGERKFAMKHSCPEVLKKAIAKMAGKSSLWKWESSEGVLARMASMADVHEKSVLNYFLVQAPVNYLAMDRPGGWDESLQDMIERTVSNCGQEYSSLGFEAKTTIRQLIYVNSARWAAKALSVGESLGTRVVYPYIWHDVLIEQGKIPWNLKIRQGVVKWPLKKMLEKFMPSDFIYRNKSGFVPPFVHWLTDAEFNDRVRGILLNGKAYVTDVIPAPVLAELLADARKGLRLRSPILTTLWGALFTERWIREQKATQYS